MSEPKGITAAMICWAECELCQFGSHFNEPTWHTWAGPEDVEHAAKTGQKDPSTSRCGCSCAGQGVKP